MADVIHAEHKPVNTGGNCISLLTQALTYSECSCESHCHACTHSRIRLIWQGLQTLMFPFHAMKEITERVADIKLAATSRVSAGY